MPYTLSPNVVQLLPLFIVMLLLVHVDVTCPENFTITTQENLTSRVIHIRNDGTLSEATRISCDVIPYSTYYTLVIGLSKNLCFDGEVSTTGSCLLLIYVNDALNKFHKCPAYIRIDDVKDEVILRSRGQQLIQRSHEIRATCNPLSSNGNSFKVTCMSTYNNDGCMFFPDIIDKTKPHITCPASMETDAESNLTTVTWDDPVVSDNVDIEKLSATCTPGKETQFDIGLTNVTCIVNDIFGNENSCMFSINIKDNKKPNITCPKSVQVNAWSNLTTVTWDDPVVTDNVDNEGLSATCDPKNQSQFEIGLTNVTCTVNDTAGNIGSCMFGVNVTDKTKPNITCPESMQVNAWSNLTTVIWDDPVVTDNVDYEGLSATCSPRNESLFQIGLTNVTCTVYDTAGNNDTCMFGVNVTDNTKPNITCPKSMDVDAKFNLTTVTWDDPVVIDNVDTEGLLATCSPRNQSQFEIGLTHVTCTVYDTAGNNDTCMFYIRVAELPECCTPLQPVTDCNSLLSIFKYTCLKRFVGICHFAISNYFSKIEK
ncbi:hyalin-like [Antedon mediterranea]|uniref:hyalin-like n=1 Tax=Antedon mediterranea TaxID=105859 RepID=UPI003AF9B5B4